VRQKVKALSDSLCVIVGIILTIYHLVQLRPLTTLHCDIPADLSGAHNLHVVGFSRARTERSISTGGKNLASLRAATQKHPASRVSLPGRRTTDVSPANQHVFFLLALIPASGATSHFYSFSVDGSDWLSMLHNDPMNIDTENISCSVVLPQGAVAYCGTTDGAVIRWNIRLIPRSEMLAELSCLHLLSRLRCPRPRLWVPAPRLICPKTKSTAP